MSRVCVRPRTGTGLVLRGGVGDPRVAVRSLTGRQVHGVVRDNYILMVQVCVIVFACRVVRVT